MTKQYLIDRVLADLRDDKTDECWGWLPQEVRDAPSVSDVRAWVASLDKRQLGDLIDSFDRAKRALPRDVEWVGHEHDYTAAIGDHSLQVRSDNGGSDWECIIDGQTCHLAADSKYAAMREAAALCR